MKKINKDPPETQCSILALAIEDKQCVSMIYKNLIAKSPVIIDRITSYKILGKFYYIPM